MASLFRAATVRERPATRAVPMSIGIRERPDAGPLHRGQPLSLPYGRGSDQWSIRVRQSTRVAIRCGFAPGDRLSGHPLATSYRLIEPGFYHNRRRATKRDVAKARLATSPVNTTTYGRQGRRGCGPRFLNGARRPVRQNPHRRKPGNPPSNALQFKNLRGTRNESPPGLRRPGLCRFSPVGTGLLPEPTEDGKRSCGVIGSTRSCGAR